MVNIEYCQIWGRGNNEVNSIVELVNNQVRQITGIGKNQLKEKSGCIFTPSCKVQVEIYFEQLFVAVSRTKI